MPRNRKLAVLVPRAVIVGWSVLLLCSPTRSEPLSDLNNEFRSAYGMAAGRVMSDLRSSVPILVNRFDQISLYRPGFDEPAVFAMDMKHYLDARSVAHTPAAVYTRLVPFGLGKLDEARLEWLAKYQSLLSAAETEIEARAQVPEDIRQVQVGLLADVRRFVQRVHQQASVDHAMLDAFGAAVRAGVRRNLEFAAASQLEQFRTQIDAWKSSYPALRWDEAVVVVIGVHQARRQNLQTQFFDWLSGDSPEREDRVVFAETLDPPPPLDKAVPAGPLLLLSKVLLDRGLARFVFGDVYALQSDVLGDAAETILKNWGR